MNKIVGVFALVIIIVGCEPEVTYRYKAKLTKLKVEDIYNADYVKNALFDAEELDVDALKRASKNEFLKGVDDLKNNNNIRGAIIHFKKAILIFPEAKLYYELGNALAKFNGKVSIEEAINAYDVARVLDFQPQGMLDYKLAVLIYRLSKIPGNEYQKFHEAEAIHKLKLAILSGYTDSVAIAKDPQLTGIEKLIGYKYVLLSTSSIQHQSEGINNMFTIFKKLFPDQPNGILITPEEVEMKKYNQSISYDFAKFIPEMESSSFGRDVGADFFYVGKLKETTMYTAIVYTSVTFAEEIMQPVFTQLVVYENKSGKILSSKTVACNCSPENIRVAKLYEDKIEVEDMNRIWEKPINKVSFLDNKISEYKLNGRATYMITEGGEIELTQKSSGFSDSLLMANN